MRVAVLLWMLLSTTCTLGRSLQQGTDLVAAPTSQQGVAASSTPAASPGADAGEQLTASAPDAGVNTVPIQPQSTVKRTLQEVNADAPTLTDPNTRASVRPVATSLLQQKRSGSTASNTQTATAQQQSRGGSGQQRIGVDQPQDVAGYKPLDSESATGDFFSAQVGARVSTQLFGTGFNFCIGRSNSHPCASHAL